MIVCSAIQINFPEKTAITIAGLRHYDCYRTLQQLNPELLKVSRHDGLIEEGFINTDHQFLTRSEAYQEAMVCGQLSATARVAKGERGDRNVLFSEDLY